jgi:hypothetical protein
VAVGTFNIYVLQPHWLVERGILPPEEITLDTNLSRPGFRLRSPSSSTEWTVVPTRLAIKSAQANRDCGELVGKVLQFLRWTPVTAVGNNLHLVGPVDEIRGAESMHAFLRTEFGFGGSAARSRQLGISVPYGTSSMANLTIAVDEPEGGKAKIAVNIHSAFQQLSTDQAVETAKRYLNDRGGAIELVRSLCRVEVSDEPINA